MEEIDERHPYPDHETAHDEGAENTPKQNPMLMLGRNFEVGKDEGDNEDVVHRQGKFDEIPGKELERFRLPPSRTQPEREEHGQAEPDRSPRQRLAEFNYVSATVE